MIGVANSYSENEFDVSFDQYWSTNSPENKHYAETIYRRLQEAGDIDRARTAAEELRVVAALYRSKGLVASAASAHHSMARSSPLTPPAGPSPLSSTRSSSTTLRATWFTSTGPVALPAAPGRA